MVFSVMGGSPCQSKMILPANQINCDVSWSLSQDEVEMGQGVAQLAAQGSDIKYPNMSVVYVATGRIRAIQVPRLVTTLQQANRATLIMPGNQDEA